MFSQQRFRHVFQQTQTTFCCQTVFDVSDAVCYCGEVFGEVCGKIVLDVNVRVNSHRIHSTEWTV